MAILWPIHAEFSPDLVRKKNSSFCSFTATTWKDSQEKHIHFPHCHIILLPSIIQRVWNTWIFKLLDKANNIDSVLCQLLWKIFLKFFFQCGKGNQYHIMRMTFLLLWLNSCMPMAFCSSVAVSHWAFSPLQVSPTFLMVRCSLRLLRL